MTGISTNLRRRDFVFGAAATVLTARSAAASGLPRLAAIDWAMLETSIALGVMPVAATELIQFRKDAIEPEIPAASSISDCEERRISSC